MQLNLWLIIALFLVLTAFGSVVFGRKPGPGLKVLSWNIRFDNPSDGVHRWDNRKERVFNFLKTQNPDLIGLQEVLHNQLQEIKAATGGRMRWLGVGRDDGQTAGEYSPIGYNHHRLELYSKAYCGCRKVRVNLLLAGMLLCRASAAGRSLSTKKNKPCSGYLTRILIMPAKMHGNKAPNCWPIASSNGVPTSQYCSWAILMKGRMVL